MSNRFVVNGNIDLEVSLYDKLTKKNYFNFICEDVKEFELVSFEVKNCCELINKLWSQTQRFEKNNKTLFDENTTLKELLEDGLCPMCGCRISKCGGLR